MIRRTKVKETLNRRWWDTKLRIYHRKINRIKHYGTKSLIKQYTDLVAEAYKPFFERLESILNSNISNEAAPGILAYILGNLGVVTFSPTTILNINKILEEGFGRGARRVFTRTGQQLKVGEITNKEPLKALARQQIIYLREMEEAIRQTVKDVITVGLGEGKSIFEIKKDIMEKSQRITKHRAETIARSEIIKVSTEGTKQSMKEAGIERYLWLTARDNRVCLICQNMEKGNSYSFEDGPMPVKDSHPNCRCTIVAEIE